MNKIFIWLLSIWIFTSPVFADSTINNLGAGVAVQSTDILPAYQGANPATGVTAAQIKTFTNSSGVATSVTAGCGLTITPTTGAVVASAPVTATNNTGTTDTITSAQCGTVRTQSNASASAIAITTAGFVSGNVFTVKNLGVGLATYTPSSGTIGGAATLVCQQGQSSDIYFDGTNFQTLGNTCTTNTSTITIATGTAVLGTSAIASGACATVVTISATGIVTTDTLMFGYNSDPTAITGYGASATGAVLTIYPYPTANNANVKVCNSTASSITPSAMTLNFKVVR